MWWDFDEGHWTNQYPDWAIELKSSSSKEDHQSSWYLADNVPPLDEADAEVEYFLAERATLQRTRRHLHKGFDEVAWMKKEREGTVLQKLHSLHLPSQLHPSQ